MKILIVYESMTGNTKDVAIAIYDALKFDYNVKVLNVVDDGIAKIWDLN